jgi:ribonuclease PH
MQQIRPIHIIKNYIKHPQGSVLISCGETKVLCNVSLEKKLPSFLQKKIVNGQAPTQGWLTAEYAMLPSATHNRNQRESQTGKLSGRTQEIQRLIGRSLRGCIDVTKIAGYTITVDCDVIQADGGTRCASITGSWVALKLAEQYMMKNHLTTGITEPFITTQIAGVSVGVNEYNDILLDLNYEQDSQCLLDMNVIMTTEQEFLELQASAEKNGFTLSRQRLNELLDVAQNGLNEIFSIQQEVLK